MTNRSYCNFLASIFLSFIAISASAGDLSKAYKYLNTGDYANAQKYLLEAQHDEPANPGVDFMFAKFYFAHDNKAYNLDSANLYIKLAASFLPLKPEDKETKRLLALGVRDYTIETLHKEINQTGFDFAERNNTVESYQYYIDNYTDTALIGRSVASRNQLAYILSRGKNNPWALDSFIKTYPNAIEINEAKELFEKLLYSQTTADSSYQSYKKYFDQYPKGAYVELAKKRYQQKLMEYYNGKHDLNSYLEFEKNYKDNPAYNAVQDSIYALAIKSQTKEAFRSFILTYKNNRNWNEAWDQFYILSTADGTEESYRKFSDQYPDYPGKSRIAGDIELSRLSLVPAKRDDKFGFLKFPVVDSTVFYFPPEYDEAFGFNCGLSGVRAKPCTKSQCTYFYIDKNNKKVFNRDFNYTGDFDKGYAIAGIGNCEVDSCKYGLIDKRGHWFIEPLYDELDEASDGFYLVSKNDRYGFMNLKGEIAISMKYNNAVSFSEGIAAVALDTNWFFIDTTGRQLFFDYFHNVSSFKDSLCAVTKDGDTWGYIDRTGTYAIPAAFDEAGDFEGGFAIVSKKEKDPKHKDMFITQRYKIDKTGKTIEKLTAPSEPAKKGSSRKKPRK